MYRLREQNLQDDQEQVGVSIRDELECIVELWSQLVLLLHAPIVFGGFLQRTLADGLHDTYHTADSTRQSEGSTQLKS